MQELLSLQPRQYFQEVLRLVTSTRELNHADVEQAVAGLYEMIGRKTPPIRYCQSPWQMSMIPIIKGFFDNTDAIDTWRLKDDLERLSNNTKDFYVLGVSALWDRCDAIDIKAAGAILLEEIADKKIDASQYSSITTKLINRDPETAEKVIASADPGVQVFLSRIFEQTVVPHKDVGFYMFQQNPDGLTLGHRNIRSGTTQSSAGDYFTQLYKPFYYKTSVVKFEIGEQPHWFGTQTESEIQREYFNMLTKRGEAYWIAQYFYNQTLLAVPEKVKKNLTALINAVTAAHDYLPFENVCLVCERPRSLNLDQGNRLHNETGPALEYSDGYAVFAVDGVIVPTWMIKQRDEIVAENITDEKNTELRRVLLKLFGEERYIREIGAQMIGEDSHGQLYRAEFPSGGEHLTMVRVENSTPEPDGSTKIYWLRVPPNTATAKEGVAWTFDMDAQVYEPTRET